MAVSFAIHQYDMTDLMNLNRVYVKMGKVRRWLFPLLRAVVFVAAVILIVSAGLLLVFWKVGPPKAVLYVACILFGVLGILVDVFMRRIFALGYRRTFVKGLGIIRVALDETGITEATDKSRSVCSCDAFSRAVYYRNAYFLFLDRRRILLLPVSAMTQGTPQELETLWERMRGEPVQHL